ncbi:MAG: hypothetical protein IT326_07150 [Anaerolineae bacterium]|nr:hypothetical protein [Anaerolineae bacterium]
MAKEKTSKPLTVAKAEEKPRAHVPRKPVIQFLNGKRRCDIVAPWNISGASDR